MSELAAEPRRIVSLDVIRGFAVLGILPVNAAFFAAPWQTAINPALAPLAVEPGTLWSWLVMHVFFEYKCITLFSMLFGASLYLVGGERDDAVRGANLRRRLFWLTIFGLIHGLLIWYGDILFTYALTGFLVLFARSWRPAQLIGIGAGLYLLALASASSFALFADYIPPEQMAEIERQMWTPPADEVARLIGAYQGGWITGLSANAESWTMMVLHALPSLIVRTAGVMMIGMGLFKLGFFSGNAPNWLYALVLAFGAGALAIIFVQANINAEAGFAFAHMQAGGMFANNALSIVVSLGYASLFIFLVKLGWRVITGPLAAVGRMAFTNYIAQSLIMSTLMWGGARGFGLYGELSRVDLWQIVLAIWALQLIWSPLWLQRFAMGPLESLWRRLTYKHGERNP